MRARTRLYLGAGGVLLAPKAGEEWGTSRTGILVYQNDDGSDRLRRVTWSPGLVRSVAALQIAFDLDVRFLSRWEEQVLTELLPLLKGIETSRYLPLILEERRADESVSDVKMRRILEAHATSPGPFLWLDDVPLRKMNAVAKAVDPASPTYVASTEREFGLTRRVIGEAWNWLEGVSSQRSPGSQHTCQCSFKSR